jgi:hypothetical protein
MTEWHLGARWGQARITWSSSPPGCGGSESSGGVGTGGSCGEKNGNRVIGVGICCAVFITAVPITKLFTWGGKGIVEDMCYERRRAEPVWTSLPITH